MSGGGPQAETGPAGGGLAREETSAPRPPRRWTTGVRDFARRIFREGDLYGALAFAEAAESLTLCRRALEIEPGERVVGVTSSADVLLSLSAQGAGDVIGFDLNPMQTALAELKREAIAAFEVEDYLRFFGITEGDGAERCQMLDRVSGSLSPDARTLLHRSGERIERGLLNAGMTHLIIRALVASLSRIVAPETMRLFLGERGTDRERELELLALAERRASRWFIRPTLRLLAPALKWLFFPHSICRVSKRPDEMIADFFVTFTPLFLHGARSNPVLSRSAAGRLHPEWDRELYSPSCFETIRRRTGSIRFSTQSINGGLAELPDRSADKIYLSNVPDYLSDPQLLDLARQIDRVARPGARVLYFSLCDTDRLDGLIGRPLPQGELDAVRAIDNVHLYPLIMVKTAGARNDA